MVETTEKKNEEIKVQLPVEHDKQCPHNVLISLQNTTYIPYKNKNKQQPQSKKNQQQRITKLPNYLYAGFWIRVISFFIDLLCISSINQLTLGILSKLDMIHTSDSYLSIYGFSSLILYLAYFVLLTKLNHGQTIGKMIFGIRVVSLDEEKLSWPTVLVREGACRFILKFPLLFVGYLPSMFNIKKQHIGDYFSNTSVVTLNLIKTFNQEIDN